MRDLIERRRANRNEPRRLADMIATRRPVDWLDRLVASRLPAMIEARCPLCAGTGYVYTLDPEQGWVPDECPAGCARPDRQETGQ